MEKQIKNVIASIGYTSVDSTKGNKSHLIGGAILLLVSGYFIHQTIGFDYLPSVESEMGYGLLVVIGLLTSIHCISICGGIALTQSMTTEAERLPKGIVSILIGIFMIFLGLRLLGIVKFKLPSLFKSKSIDSLPLKSTQKKSTPFLIGIANGFMPCGPLQTMQLYALGTGSIITGAASMFFFSLGTVPLMLGFGFITSKMSKASNHKIARFSGVLVIVLGLIMSNRGLAVSGYQTIGLGALNSFDEKEAVAAISIDGQQIINLTVSSSTYKLDQTIVQKGQPVRINFNVESITGCNNPIVIPEYNLEINLNEDSFVEFIPESTGKITISCWMGMIYTQSDSVDSIEDYTNTNHETPISDPPQPLQLDSCCSVPPSNENDKDK